MTTTTKQAFEVLEQVRHAALPQGKVACDATWIRQKGEMRMAPDRPWLPFVAEEWFSGPDIDFSWKAWLRIAPFVRMRVIDSFHESHGSLTASLFGFVPIVKSLGPQFDKGEALRGLAELPWRPSAFQETPCLTWQISSADRLVATFDDGATHATAEFQVDPAGHILGGSAARPRMVGKTLIDTPWSGVFDRYRTFDRVSVPTYAEVSWNLPDGVFTYWRGEVTEFRVLA